MVAELWEESYSSEYEDWQKRWNAVKESGKLMYLVNDAADYGGVMTQLEMIPKDSYYRPTLFTEDEINALRG